MKLEVNITNKAVYLLIGILIVLGIGGIAYAYGSGDPTVHGHDAGEVEGVGVVTGSYTGNGVSNRIINLGFEPSVLEVHTHLDGGLMYLKSNTMPDCRAKRLDSGQWQNSLEFTAGGFKICNYINTNGIVYSYIAWR